MGQLRPFSKAKRGHCGVASETPQTLDHMQQQCPRFALLTATLPIFPPRHCGVASETPQTLAHMQQQCPRFALLTATLPIFPPQFLES
jgi:hypothetical protein